MRHNSRNVIEWRKRARNFLIDVLGNKCSICGYNDECDAVYDIHHINPSQKEISFSRLSTIGMKKCLAEAKKCVLLCAICHRKLHAGLLKIEDATYFYDDEKAEQYLITGTKF